ncbi:hypothetical protein Pelo_17099 [Pelomyxa schiedti]|nr:hypothetical protein Pelo_17099 [Pelomyxa schiedti]
MTINFTVSCVALGGGVEASRNDKVEEAEGTGVKDPVEVEEEDTTEEEHTVETDDTVEELDNVEAGDTVEEPDDVDADPIEKQDDVEIAGTMGSSSACQDPMLMSRRMLGAHGTAHKKHGQYHWDLL